MGKAINKRNFTKVGIIKQPKSKIAAPITVKRITKDTTTILGSNNPAKIPKMVKVVTPKVIFGVQLLDNKVRSIGIVLIKKMSIPRIMFCFLFKNSPFVLVLNLFKQYRKMI